jgi:hypothetical protein
LVNDELDDSDEDEGKPENGDELPPELAEESKQAPDASDGAVDDWEWVERGARSARPRPCPPVALGL